MNAPIVFGQAWTEATVMLSTRSGGCTRFAHSEFQQEIVADIVAAPRSGLRSSDHAIGPIPSGITEEERISAMATSAAIKANEDIAPGERQVRIDLAAAYRLVALYLSPSTPRSTWRAKTRTR